MKLFGTGVIVTEAALNTRIISNFVTPSLENLGISIKHLRSALEISPHSVIIGRECT